MILKDRIMYEKLDQFAALLLSDDPEIKKMISCLSKNDMYFLKDNYKRTLVVGYRKDSCTECSNRSHFDQCIFIKDNKRFCASCKRYVAGPRVDVQIVVDPATTGTRTH